MSSTPITCHILDTTRGRPASDVLCEIFSLASFNEPTPFATARTNGDGRIPKWNFSSEVSKTSLAQIGINDDWEVLKAGVYKIRFHTKEYFQEIALQEDATDSTGRARTFFPFVDIIFEVASPPDHHYHVPLLLSNHGYSTYRGS
ncbi:unnamed protein product [Kuraishia capsulata CBS 1993]|uniref:5-hydroxyisourate hydrolase n=1 Tax=Kuraishia capsulata CBS 1993 TaxID=1382522 RepID=W6MLG4_9ASCO|nr:uncharacterized protein KUCA_T00001622001 [Kuraishia capsulata CBS 1993]CDK25652.1 unnamed protein product [Kuraishia capsulata CBS 1993]